MAERTVQQNPFYSSGAAMFRVTCVVREKRICGYLENACFEKPVSFQGLDDMVLRIDDMCNLTQFPAASTQARNLKKDGIVLKPRFEKNMYGSGREYSPYEWLRSRRVPKDFHPEDAEEYHEFFLIHIMFRQHASLQGLLVHGRGEQEGVHFRSALELLRMMASCFPSPDASNTKKIPE